MHYGEIIEEQIKAHGLLKAFVAEKANLPPWKLSRIIKKGNLAYDEGIALAKAIGLPPDFFYRELREMKTSKT